MAFVLDGIYQTYNPSAWRCFIYGEYVFVVDNSAYNLICYKVISGVLTYLWMENVPNIWDVHVDSENIACARQDTGLSIYYWTDSGMYHKATAYHEDPVSLTAYYNKVCKYKDIYFVACNQGGLRAYHINQVDWSLNLLGSTPRYGGGYPDGITVDDDGYIYVGNGSGTPRFLVYTFADGVFTLDNSYSGPNFGSNIVQDIAVTTGKYIWCASSGGTVLLHHDVGGGSIDWVDRKDGDTSAVKSDGEHCYEVQWDYGVSVLSHAGGSIVTVLNDLNDEYAPDGVAGNGYFVFATYWDGLLFYKITGGFGTNFDYGMSAYKDEPGDQLIPLSIMSAEHWGTPTINLAGLAILPTSILSGEHWGTPQVTQPTVVESALPPAALPTEGDILFTLDPQLGYGDCQLGDRDVVRDPGFETAILLTIGTDKRVDDTELDLPADDGYKGGWFGDELAEIAGDQIGWKGWLLRRAKTQSEVLSRCKEYLADGFQWMIRDGIISEFESEISRVNYEGNTDELRMILRFIRPTGNEITYTFYYNWQAQILKRG